MRALIRQTGLFRIKTKYANAMRASWKTASKEFVYARSKQSKLTAARIAFAKASAEFFQYLHSHDGHSTLKPLTPIMLRSDQIAKYERELLAALDIDKQPNTRNIAISGTCSASKSSFLNSFVERNPQYNYIKISLGRFTGINPDNCAHKEILSDIEQDIIQQLLFSVSGKKLETNPDLKTEPDKWKKYTGILTAFLTSSSIATLSYVNGNLGINQSTTVKALRLHLPDYLIVFLKKYAPLLAEFSLFFLATILVLFLFKGLQKLSVGWVDKNNRRRMTEVPTISRSYLNQITQAFDQDKMSVVIIEDLMCANRPLVFEVLHHINRHINSSAQLEQPVYFIHTLEDEALTARDKTRFFDLIIPIVPVINMANAGLKLYEQLETIKVGEQSITDFLDKELIYKVADYIDDVRIITNIVNEFDIYLNKVTNNIEALNKNKLFTMMVIKNLYPKEHAELTYHRGILWEVFNEFAKKKRSTIEEYNLKIEHYQEDVGSYENAYIKNIKELRAIYWLKIFETIKSDSGQISTKATGKVTICDFVENHFWEQAYQSSDIIHIDKMIRHGQESLPTGLTLYEIANSTKPTYEVRAKLISKDIELTRAYIEALEHTRNKLLCSNLSEALSEGTIGDSFLRTLTEEQFGPLLYLITRGYFAEDYKDYLSFFYPGSISRDDQRFSLQLGEGRSFKFSQKVDFPKALPSHLTRP